MLSRRGIFGFFAGAAVAAPAIVAAASKANAASELSGLSVVMGERMPLEVGEIIAETLFPFPDSMIADAPIPARHLVFGRCDFPPNWQFAIDESGNVIGMIRLDDEADDYSPGCA